MRIEDRANFIPIIEGYCKKGDLLKLSEFISKEKSLLSYVIENLRSLMYKSIEAKQHQILKYLLTSLPQSQNYNLLHIACRPNLN